MGYQSECPTCGASIEFSVANSVVTVCGNCDTVCGRADGSLENLGKVAELTDTDSPLQVGLMGKSRGVPFLVTGRTQLRHEAGGVWDEWYVAFRDGGQWGWLAEARGRYYLTFHKKLPENHHVPAISELNVEDDVMIPKSGVMKVVEIGRAEVVSGEGEIPFELHPGEVYPYADLEGPGGKFATLDGGTDPPTLYVGGEFPLERLGIDAEARDREREERRAAAAQVSCPQCGGTLDLKAPDETLRVGCPYCGALLDASQGSLTFLKALRHKFEPTIPLGSKGTLDDIEFTVIGFMRRFVRVSGRDYDWNEYLLYAPRRPFHWLIENQRHWTFSRPISAGEVRMSYRSAVCEGKTFRLFDRGRPEVRYVVGEFYWKVEIGEQVKSADYVHAPWMLSREETTVPPKDDTPPKRDTPPKGGVPPVRGESKKRKRRAAKEVNYTLGRYAPVEEIEQAFGRKTPLPRPSGVAPNQPYKYKNVYPLWLVGVAAALVVGLFVFVTAPRKLVFSRTFDLPKTSAVEHIEFVETPIRLSGWRNIEITCANDQSRQWGFVKMDLIDQKDKRKTVTVPIHQSQAGRGRSATKYLSAMPTGNYRPRFAFQWQNMQIAPQKITVKIRQGVPRLRYAVFLLILISLFPIGVAIHHGTFESSRWSESGV